MSVTLSAMMPIGATAVWCNVVRLFWNRSAEALLCVGAESLDSRVSLGSSDTSEGFQGNGLGLAAVPVSKLTNPRRFSERFAVPVLVIYFHLDTISH